jgi:hypothetical protein
MKKYFRLFAALTAAATIALICLVPRTDHPPAHEVAGFEYVTQPDQITCGPTSTLMVLRRYGKTATLAAVEAETKTKWVDYRGTPVGMTSPEYVAAALRHFGVPATLRRGSLDALQHAVSCDRPCVALLRSGPRTWHYVVVTGYTPATIVTADPGDGQRHELPVADFLGAWRFTTDMGGVPQTVPCRACGGTGAWLGLDIGPLAKCEVCAGSGRTPDYLAAALRLAEVCPETYIAPARPVAEPVINTR